MKNHINIVLTAFFVLFALSNANAQKTQKQTRGNTTRCFTMERIEHQLNSNPPLRLYSQQRANENTPAPNSNHRISGIVTIPIVVHIVLPNPFIVTDADVQVQLNQLNLDYAGLNPDSTNIPPEFAAVRGHSQIRFCLAKEDAYGSVDFRH